MSGSEPGGAADSLRELLDRSLGGTYRIERELGGGAMSRVFLAEERALGQRVVVKVLSHELAPELSAERFVLRAAGRTLFATDAQLDRLRGDERFTALLARMRRDWEQREREL